MASLFNISTQEQMLGRVHNLSPASQRQWGKMSVSQMMKHMAAAFALPLSSEHPAKEPLYYLMANPVSRKLMFDIIPWPHGLPAPKAILVKDDPAFESTKNEFVAAIGKFLSAIEFPGIHPVFGSMDKENWGKLMGTHLDHHLRQFNV